MTKTTREEEQRTNTNVVWFCVITSLILMIGAISIVYSVLIVEIKDLQIRVNWLEQNHTYSNDLTSKHIDYELKVAPNCSVAPDGCNTQCCQDGICWTTLMYCGDLKKQC